MVVEITTDEMTYNEYEVCDYTEIHYGVYQLDYTDGTSKIIEACDVSEAE